MIYTPAASAVAGHFYRLDVLADAQVRKSRARRTRRILLKYKNMRQSYNSRLSSIETVPDSRPSAIVSNEDNSLDATPTGVLTSTWLVDMDSFALALLELAHLSLTDLPVAQLHCRLRYRQRL